MRVIVTCLAILVLTASEAFAQISAAEESRTASCEAVAGRLQQQGRPVSAPELPLSNFGVGVAADHRLSGPTRVNDAAVVNGNVTVVDVNDVTAGPVFEAHAFVFTVKRKFGVRDDKGRLYVTEKRPCASADEFQTVGMGPFTMLRLGESQLIKSIGFGWMFGFRVKESDKSFNIGFALTLQQDVKTLATGFEDGKPLPTGEESIRFRSDDGTGAAVVISFGW